MKCAYRTPHRLVSSVRDVSSERSSLHPSLGILVVQRGLIPFWRAPPLPADTFSVSTITKGHARTRKCLFALEAEEHDRPVFQSTAIPESGCSDPHPRSSRSSLRSWMCHNTWESTVLSRVSCRPSSEFWSFSSVLRVTWTQFQNTWGSSFPYHVMACFTIICRVIELHRQESPSARQVCLPAMSDGWLRGLGIDWEVVGSDFSMSSFSFSAIVISGWWMLRSGILCDFTSRRTVKIWLYRWLFKSIGLRWTGSSCPSKILYPFFVVSRSSWLDFLRHFLSRAGYLIMKRCFTINDRNFCWKCCSTRFLKCSSRWVESNTRPEEK